MAFILIPTEIISFLHLRNSSMLNPEVKRTFCVCVNNRQELIVTLSTAKSFVSCLCSAICLVTVAQPDSNHVFDRAQRLTITKCEWYVAMTKFLLSKGDVCANGCNKWQFHSSIAWIKVINYWIRKSNLPAHVSALTVGQRSHLWKKRNF